MDIEDGEIIKSAAGLLNNSSDSILITQKRQNANHYDTSILKLIKVGNKKIFELYLFQETLYKDLKEGLFNSILIEDGTSLKYKLYLFQI